VGVGRGVGVAQRLVGDQQVPRDRLQLGGVAVERPVGREHDAGPFAERAVERADLPGDRSAVVERQEFDVGRECRESAAGRAAGELVAPLAEQPAFGDHDPAEACGGAGAVRDRAAGGDRLAGADLAGVDAGADDLQGGDLLLASEQDRVVGERPGEHHPYELARAGVERHRRPGVAQRAQLGGRLLGDDAAGAGRHPVGGGDRERAGAALHAPDAGRVA
jgi:hypothetical protein